MKKLRIELSVCVVDYTESLCGKILTKESQASIKDREIEDCEAEIASIGGDVLTRAVKSLDELIEPENTDGDFPDEFESEETITPSDVINKMNEKYNGQEDKDFGKGTE